MKTAQVVAKDDGRGIITINPDFSRMIEIAIKAARAGMNLIISGESGTGRSLLARYIHSVSSLENCIFCDLDNIVSVLAAKELFGAIRGAFTGADQEMPGLFQSAADGTIIFRGIAEAEPAVRNKLIGPLSRKEVLPIGSQQPVKISASIISIFDGVGVREKIGEELFHLLNGVSIILPPLRERKEDIPVLANHFLRKSMEQFSKNGISISEAGLDFLSYYQWPGNVRELENTIAQATLYADSEITYGLLRGFVEQRLFFVKGTAAEIHPVEKPESLNHIAVIAEKTPLNGLPGEGKDISSDESGKSGDEQKAEVGGKISEAGGTGDITPFSIPNKENPFFNREILVRQELIGGILEKYQMAFPLLRYLDACRARLAVEIILYINGQRKKDKKALCIKMGLKPFHSSMFRKIIKSKGIDISARETDPDWRVIFQSGKTDFGALSDVSSSFKEIVIQYALNELHMNRSHVQKYFQASNSFLYWREKKEKKQSE